MADWEWSLATTLRLSVKLREKIKNHAKDAVLIALGAVVVVVLEYQKFIDKRNSRR